MCVYIAKRPKKNKQKLAEWLEEQGVEDADIAYWKGELNGADILNV